MQITCPHCRRNLERSEEAAGLMLRCDSCGQQVLAPQLARPVVPLALPVERVGPIVPLALPVEAAAPTIPLALPVAQAQPIEPPLAQPGAFAGLGAGETQLDREKEHQRRQWSTNLRGLVMVGGTGLGAACASAVTASWGMGVQYLFTSLGGSLAGMVVLAAVGTALAAFVVFRLMFNPYNPYYGWGRTFGPWPAQNLHLFLIAGACGGALVGSMLGAAAGAQIDAGAIPAAPTATVTGAPPKTPRTAQPRTGPHKIPFPSIVMASLGGAGFGSLPGSFLLLRARKRQQSVKGRPASNMRG